MTRPVVGPSDRARSLALLYDFRSAFIARDAEILAKHFNLHELRYRGKRDLASLARIVMRSSGSISWFALGYAYSAATLSRMLGKPSLIIAGGWDVAFEPAIGYGAMNNPRRVRLTTNALQSASMVLAVSEATKREVLQWIDREVHVVPHGVDPTRFGLRDGNRDGVVTVANVGNWAQFRVKAIELLLAVARQLPDVSFRLIGRVADEMHTVLEQQRPPNVTLLGWLDESELIEALQSGKVYFQPSYRESFGVALLEAMSCGCVPVVSDRMALPEVVGDAGLVCPFGDSDGMAEAIRKALRFDGMPARARVMGRYTLRHREEKLLRLLGELLS